jgi:hypothetical protein
MHARREHAVDIGDRAGQFLAQRIDHLRALLHRRGDEAVLFEDVVHRGELLPGQAVLVQQVDGLGEAVFIHVDGVFSTLDADALGGNAVAEQRGDDLVRLSLVEIGVKLDIAAGQPDGDQRQGGEPEDGGPPRKKAAERARSYRGTQWSLPARRSTNLARAFKVFFPVSLI